MLSRQGLRGFTGLVKILLLERRDKLGALAKKWDEESDVDDVEQLICGPDPDKTHLCCGLYDNTGGGYGGYGRDYPGFMSSYNIPSRRQSLSVGLYQLNPADS